jgi:hypothetical protein
MTANGLPASAKAAAGNSVYETLCAAVEHATNLADALGELSEDLSGTPDWTRWHQEVVALQRALVGRCERAQEAVFDALKGA